MVVTKKSVTLALITGLGAGAVGGLASWLLDVNAAGVGAVVLGGFIGGASAWIWPGDAASKALRARKRARG